jgi:hypothetical protein
MIDSELRAFLEGGLGIHIGTRTARLEPNGARVAAVRVEDDGLHLVAYVAEAAVTRVLADLRATGPAALVFARPIDDRACQVKGIFVDARPALPAERDLIAAQWDRFLGNLEKIGIPRVASRGWITWPAVALRLRATAVFEQTPGPAAGGLIVSRP